MYQLSVSMSTQIELFGHLKNETDELPETTDNTTIANCKTPATKPPKPLTGMSEPIKFKQLAVNMTQNKTQRKSQFR